jgi:hypothetical protein
MKSAPVIGSFLLMVSALCAMMLGGCMESKLPSSWPAGEISIDGKAAEWAGREAYYSEDDGFKVGFANDAKYLYVYLATWNRQKQMQILANGLTVWIDATGHSKETFGINYPEKRSMPDSTGMSPGMPAGLRGGGRGGAPSDDSGENRQSFLKGMLAEAQSELIVLGPGGEPIVSMPAADNGKGGIAAMIDIANRTLIYEVRIPLAPSDSLSFAVNAAPGAMIGVGFKVGKSELPSMKPRGERSPDDMGGSGGGMGGPGGGMGGPGGGMGGMGGGMGRSGGGPGGGLSSQAFEYWAKVRLAAAPAAPQKP